MDKTHVLSSVLVHQVSPPLHIHLDADLCANLDRLRDIVHGVKVAPEHLSNDSRLARLTVLAFNERDESSAIRVLATAFREEDRVEQLHFPLVRRSVHNLRCVRRTLLALPLRNRNRRNLLASSDGRLQS